jgi:hypothetical protein
MFGKTLSPKMRRRRAAQSGDGGAEPPFCLFVILSAPSFNSSKLS